MTNSFRKTPICAMTMARSDKRFKQAEHRRERSAVKIALAHDQELESWRAYGDPCMGEKDGKQYCLGFPGVLRK